MSACGGPGTDPGDGGDGETGLTAEDGTAGEHPAEFGPESELTLRISDEVPPELTLQMGRDEVAELFGDVANDIVLLQIDSTPLLTNTLDTVKFACGSDWQLDNEDPNHDCSLTELGQSFGDGNWQTSPEFSMVRILTMTPANSVVTGTSLEGVEGAADFFAMFTGGFSEMMAESLKIAVTDEFLDTDAVVSSLRHNLIGTHPEATPAGLISVTLADALTDMATLGARLGPVGDHPGILVPDYPTYGPVLGPDFEMKVAASSNLRVLDGVDLGAGKDYISVIADVTGPSFDDEAEFDFNDPAKFSLTGLTPNPTLDLRFAIYEHHGFIPACSTDVSEACVGNKPGTPVGDGLVWTLDRWDLEYMVGYAGLGKYETLMSVVTKVWTDVVRVGMDGNPGGWAVFDVPGGSWFDEPPSQFVWELINEVAQHNLHHLDPEGPPTFAEGDANVAFTLEQVPVGITGPEAADGVRPFLQAQASDIAGYLLGNYKANSGPVDFYYRRAEDGNPYLFWVTPADLHDDLPYAWDRPGFYADPDLTQKLSSVDVGIGDSTHEKLAVTAGETVVYAEDDDGVRYRVRIVAPAGDLSEISVNVAPRMD
ncbi:hypothetical protein [Enhygromyxa salina]|uniref:hypothetical protein n=1 Tax=Enhygromyxa salina TaxID=215803 RepID=UPI0011B217E4|nr:hypothetical protein [Enhygromyxa salina]